MILGVLLVFTIVVSRACGSNRDDITQQEAVDIAIERASFVPCAQGTCRTVRFLEKGPPPVGYWKVVLSDSAREPSRTETFLIDANTGAVSKEAPLDRGRSS